MSHRVSRNRVMRVVELSGAAALALAVSIAGPASANTRDRFTIDDVIENTYSCGVVETTHVLGRGTASFDADGNWLGTTIHFTYDGTFTDPATGRSIPERSSQTVTENDGLIATRGQGIFLRVAGEGVVLHDVGRLVFDPSDGSTVSATPKVIPFDDPDIGAKIDAAVCSMFD